MDEQRAAAEWHFIKDHWIPLNCDPRRYFGLPEPDAAPRKTSGRKKQPGSSARTSDDRLPTHRSPTGRQAALSMATAPPARGER